MSTIRLIISEKNKSNPDFMNYYNSLEKYSNCMEPYLLELKSRIIFNKSTISSKLPEVCLEERSKVNEYLSKLNNK